MILSDKQFYIVIAIGAVALYAAKVQAEEAAEAIDPLNQDNIFNNFFDAATRKITGRETDKFGRELTFGAWLSGA